MLSDTPPHVLTAPGNTSYWNPMQWIQEKFAPAPKKASERAVKHQDATPAQDEVFQEVSTSDSRAKESPSKTKQPKPAKRPKQPAHEVLLAFRM